MHTRIKASIGIHPFPFATARIVPSPHGRLRPLPAVAYVVAVRRDLTETPGADEALAFLRDAYAARLTRAGKTAEQLIQQIDLSPHGNFAADTQQNAGAIRAVFAKAPGL